METTMTPETAEFSKGILVVCKASAAYLDPTSENYKLHFCHPDKLVRGVCPACAKKFAKHSPGVHSGHAETPADMSEPVHRPNLRDDNACRAAPGAEAEPTTWFNFDDVDALLGTIEAAPADARQQAGALVREIFTHCFAGPLINKRALTRAVAKFAAIGAGLRPELLNNMTQTQIAKSLNCTKSNLSKASVNFRNAFGVEVARGRSQAVREAMRRTRLANPMGRNFSKSAANKRSTGAGGGHPVVKDSF